jgi:hypothetical protein
LREKNRQKKAEPEGSASGTAFIVAALLSAYSLAYVPKPEASSSQ